MYVSRLITQGDLALYETLYDGEVDATRQFFERLRQALGSIDLSTPTTLAVNDGTKSVTYCLVSEENEI